MTTTIRTERWNLACDLSEEEHLQRSMKLASMVQKKFLLEDEAKRKSKLLKKEIDDLTLEINVVSAAVASKKEHREIKVELFKDMDKKTIETMRTDTGEIVDSRPLTEAELQDDFQFEGQTSSPRRIGVVGS